MGMTTDAEYLRAARSDAGAFRSFYERYASQVHAYHLRRCRNADAAHDLTAETFAQAWFARHRFRDEAGGSAGPWLFAIARNVLLLSVRRKRLERGACDRLGLLDARADSMAQPTEAWLDGLDDALADLPDEQRQAIGLRVLADLSYDDIAAALDTTPGAVRVRVHRGLAALRNRLQVSKEEA
jgi:RNA polymerase sigma factor (sigma-70 family)